MPGALWLTLIVYLLCLLTYYPITLKVEYAERKLKAYWLPRVCGGYLKPRRIALSRSTRKLDRAGRRLDISLRGLLACLHIVDLSFLFYPGYGYARCIFAIRAGDIMIMMLNSARGGGRRKRRKRWNANMKYSP